MYQNILVPTDGSTLSKRAVAPAAFLAREGGGAVTVLGVAPGAAAEAVEHILLPLALPEEQGEARDSVAEVEAELHGEGVERVQGVVARGDAADQIVAEAERRGVDLIVMSSHGRSALRDVLIGSVAEDVITRASCPVLLLRPEDDGAG
ncbi:MAG: universal stress protein [Dehalococcoidia bacterium]